MTRSSMALVFLSAYLLLLTGLSFWSARRNRNAYEFFLAGRKLGPAIVGLGFSGALSGTVLIGLSTAAYLWGLAAIWIALALMCGTLLNGCYVAPRLRALSLVHNSWTLPRLLAQEGGDRMYRRVAWSAAFIVCIALFLMASAELRTASAMANLSFRWPSNTVALSAMGLVLIYVAVGGLLSISILSAIQAVVMLVIALLLTGFALTSIGGPLPLLAALKAMHAQTGWFGARTGVVALAFTLGVVGTGLGACGQPQLLHRFMSLGDPSRLRRATGLALAWTFSMVVCMLVIGWCAKGLIPELGGFDILTEFASRRMPPLLAAFVTFATMASIVVALGMQLLLVTAALTVDSLRPAALPSLEFARVLMPFIAACIVLSVLYVPQTPAEQAIFAINALGAAFAPLVLVRLAGKRLRAGSMLGAMWAGFGLTSIFHAMPDAPGDFLECVLPLVASLGIALTGGERRHNPDRADRAAATVHDRMPI